MTNFLKWIFINKKAVTKVFLCVGIVALVSGVVHANSHAPAAHDKTEHVTEHAADHAVKPADGHAETVVTAETTASTDDHEAVAEEDSPKKCVSFFDRVVNTFKSMHHKVQQLYSMEYENDRLKYENTALRIALEQEKLAASTQKIKAVADSNSKEIRKETKHEAGRLLASIKEEIPTNLNDDEMFALASSYFRNRYDEKSAAILLKLIDLDEDAKFETAQTYMMLGVSFFRLKNDQASLKFLDKAEALTKNQRVKNQIDLWRAAVYQRQGDNRHAQERMHAVLNRNPKSQEARWVNPTGDERDEHEVRAPASEHH